VLGIIAVNAIAFTHAFKFSHFDTSGKKTVKPEELTLPQKLTILLTGISNPKPKNTLLPTRPFETLKIKTHHDYTLDTWHIKADNSLGTVLLFHGYTGKKSDMLDEAEAFLNMGYNTVLVDFYGSGDSDGAATSVGYFEGEDVANTYNHIAATGEKNIILFGASMGAVAIANATANHHIQPQSLVLECPYGKLLTTVENRFDLMGVPSLGFAHLLVFWGGAQDGYWAFNLNTIEFAKKIKAPTLLLHGAKDQRAPMDEVEAIHQNLQGLKQLTVFPEAAHESYLTSTPEAWKKSVHQFLTKNTP